MRYVHLPAAAVDTALLEDATRRGELQSPASLLQGWREAKADEDFSNRSGTAGDQTEMMENAWDDCDNTFTTECKSHEAARGWHKPMNTRMHR